MAEEEWIMDWRPPLCNDCATPLALQEVEALHEKGINPSDKDVVCDECWQVFVEGK